MVVVKQLYSTRVNLCTKKLTQFVEHVGIKEAITNFAAAFALARATDVMDQDTRTSAGNQQFSVLDVTDEFYWKWM